MELKNHLWTPNKGVPTRLLQWVNLRPEESDRTWLMFAFYTATSIGLRWSEDSTVALFLDKYGAQHLPWIYIASAVNGTLLVYLYSWLQQIFPLRQIIVAIAPCMFVPLVVFNWGMQFPYLGVITIFLLRLWVDAFYVVNELNTSIAANQLFNIREIKRAYPLVSSGLLVADVISGFSLPFLLIFVGLENVIMPFAGVFITLGALILWHLSRNYQQVFPDAPLREVPEVRHSQGRHLSNPLKQYAFLLFGFFTLLHLIGVLVDFQYLTQLESNFEGKDIASFLGVLGGITGICELVMQVFISSRVLERFGVFFSAATLPLSVGILMPVAIALLNFLPGSQSQKFLWGLVILKFSDELLRYTLVTSSGPLLFQPIPDKIRSYVQALSGGIAEAFATGIGGVFILVSFWFATSFTLSKHNFILLAETIAVALVCLGVVLVMRSRYVNLLVFSAGRGHLSGADVDLRAFKQAVIKALGEQGTEADKHSCIELLSQIDSKGAGEILAPLLLKLPPSLQIHSLEVMLAGGANPAYLPEVRALLDAPNERVAAQVFALALRYLWLAESNPNLAELEEYLKHQQHSVIQATAAVLLLRYGTPMQKVEAIHILRRMLTHKNERLRVNAVKALSEAVYLQELRIYIPNLLQDESLRVRCAVLEMIAGTHLEEYYSALLSGLYYKSTRSTAIQSLVHLENEALPMLVSLATNIYKPEVVRMYAWRTIGQISTSEAIDALWQYLETSKGTTRYHILRTLLKRYQQEGIVSLLDKTLENKVKRLIDKELQFLGYIYAAYIDFDARNKLKNSQFSDQLNTVCDLLQRSLLELEIDVKERLLLLLELLYSPEIIKAVAFNLRSESVKNWARGLEILDHTVKLPNKSVLLNILDKRSPKEKLQKIVEKGIVEYQKMELGDRTRSLIIDKESLSDWCLACCFHFARVSRIRLTSEQVLESLRHPTGYVREAAISYLYVVSRRVLLELIPQLKNDPHPLVASQIKRLIAKYGVSC
ncbi:MFS transporter [Scytonema sp. UIC 10036]|uniref:HEAT repeat domain-containing protein n=1 Tax=Scytonema sp. UIC 10036 TaxID=2304196 RepID=UPI0012DA11D4|nr:HEAT repeat domain-containing protein [Scytonema sp. UIC 10036]MUH01669.1 MFS transporter [Scytonema sp. UIC 10036]